MDWIEGLPAVPGDYWFCFFEPHRPFLLKPRQGRSTVGADGKLHHIAADFIYKHRLEPPNRVWHMPLEVPQPPEVDRTCPGCPDPANPKSWCRTCGGEGTV
jgi:hypothetical protein